MDKCEKCGLDLFGVTGKQAKYVVSTTPEVKLNLIQYLECRNPQCEAANKEIINVVPQPFEQQ